MEKVYIGICCSAHDPAVAILNEKGELVFAEASERSLQYKRALNVIADHYPFISSVLKKYIHAETSLVISKNWSKGHHRNVKMAEILLSSIHPLFKKIPFFKVWLDKYNFMLKLQSHSFAFSGQNLIREWQDHFISGGNQVKNNKLFSSQYFDHHLCHAASAAYASPYEEADVAVVDGYGEMTSTAFYHFKNNRLTKVNEIKKSKNSLGFFYSFLCLACGFNPELGEEWKVMGLAPYGKILPSLYTKLSLLIPVINGSFCNHNLLFDIAFYDKHFRDLTKNENYDVKDIACTGQKVFEDKMMESLTYFHQFSKNKNLVLTGGCALNSSCNGKITARTPYENLYVYNAPGDDGTAVGAAILAYLQDKPASSINRQILRSPYHGSVMEKGRVNKLIENCPFKYDLGDAKYATVAKLLSMGYILGYVQERAEFGPRSLGNRSILADPRKEEIKDTINNTIKYREEFRPFAPSVLEEYGAEIFENYQTSYYMDRTLVIKSEYRDKIKGVTHVDGTGRLQSVSKSINPNYHRLITEFYKLTGVPVLLNTSFNLAGKPIVHSTDDLIAALYSSGLHGIVVEDVLFTKTNFNLQAL